MYSTRHPILNERSVKSIKISIRVPYSTHGSCRSNSVDITDDTVVYDPGPHLKYLVTAKRYRRFMKLNATNNLPSWTNEISIFLFPRLFPSYLGSSTLVLNLHSIRSPTSFTHTPATVIISHSIPLQPPLLLWSSPFFLPRSIP